MKSFKEILSEVAKPNDRASEEQAFIDQHSYEVRQHPVALDHQFTGDIGAAGLPREKASRPADQTGDANYDKAYDAGLDFPNDYIESALARRMGVDLEEATASAYKDMPKAPGKMVSNRVQVKAFKDVNAMGAFLGKQNDNSWKDTGVAGLKSGKYKIDMVSKGGKPAKNFIKMNEEAELDEVSQETLKSYHAKSALDLRNKRDKLAKGTLTTKDYKQGQNRATGLNRAANKMHEAEQLDELGNKYVMDKKDLAAVQSKLNTMKNPPKVIKDKAGYFHLKNGNSTTGPFNTMKDVLKNLGESN
jgi:hypothetical protein